MKTYADRHEDDQQKLKRKKNIFRSGNLQRQVSEMGDGEIMRMATYSEYGGQIQRKMDVSQPGDASEVQADEVAESFMRGDVERSQNILSNATSEVSRKGEGGGMQTSDEFDQQLLRTKGKGQQLDEGMKSELEEHTGTDLSGVNIHANAQAHDMNESINAKAFTYGQDIYFKQGNYDPQSEQGKNLLAHEVTHTVQQSTYIQTKVQRQEEIKDENKPEVFTIWVTAPFSGIADGDPDYEAAYLYLVDLYDGLNIPDEKIRAESKNTNLQTTKDDGTVVDFAAKGGWEEFKVDYTVENYIRHLSSIYSEITHVTDFLSDFEKSAFTPGTDQLYAAGEVAVALSEISVEDYELFQQFEVLKEINQSFAQFVRNFKSGLVEIKEILNTNYTSKQRAEKLHNELLSGGGAGRHYIIMALTLNLSEEESKKTQEEYRKKYNVNLLNDIFDTFLVDWNVAYVIFKNLHVNATPQTEVDATDKTKPYFTATPPANEIAEGKVMGFEFHPVGLDESKLEFYWFVQFDPKGMTMYELEARGTDPDVYYTRNIGKYFNTVFFIPGHHEVICRVEDHSGSEVVIKHYSYNIWVRSAYEVIQGQKNVDLEQQGTMATDLGLSLVSSNELLIKAVAENIISQDLLDKYLAADVEISKQESKLNDPADTFSVNTVTIQSYYDAVWALVKPFEEKKTAKKRKVSVDYGHTNIYFITTPIYYDSTSELTQATSKEQWFGVYRRFALFVRGMEKYVADQFKEKGFTAESESMEFFSGLTYNLIDTKLSHPDAKKVKAVFYPKEYGKDVTFNNLAPDQIPGIPFFFYTWYDHAEKEWVLKDLTQPDIIKTNTKSGDADKIPHRELFAELDSSLRFPEGILIYQLPDGTQSTLYTHDESTLADWLSWIGIALGLITLAMATAGASVPVSLVVLSSGIAVSASILKYAEYQQQGMLDTIGANLELLNVVSSLMPLGAVLGKLKYSKALMAGETVALQAVKNWYLIPSFIGMGADIVSFGIVAEATWAEYQKVIGNPNIPDEQKVFLLTRMTANFILQGLFMFIGMKGNVKMMTQLKPGTDIYYDRDFAGELTVRPLLDVDSIKIKMTERKFNPQSQDSFEYILSDKSGLSQDVQDRVHSEVVGAVYNDQIAKGGIEGLIGKMKQSLSVPNKDPNVEILAPLSELRSANRTAYEGKIANNTVGYVSYTPTNSKTVIPLGNGKTTTIEPLTDVDFLYLSKDNMIHIDEVKLNMKTLRNKLNEKKKNQLDNLVSWRKKETDREFNIKIEQDEQMNELFGMVDKKNEMVIESLVAAETDVYVGAQKLSTDQLKLFLTNFKAKNLRGPDKKTFLDKIKTVSDLYLYLQ